MAVKNLDTGGMRTPLRQAGDRHQLGSSSFHRSRIHSEGCVPEVVEGTGSPGRTTVQQGSQAPLSSAAVSVSLGWPGSCSTISGQCYVFDSFPDCLFLDTVFSQSVLEESGTPRECREGPTQEPGWREFLQDGGARWCAHATG